MRRHGANARLLQKQSVIDNQSLERNQAPRRRHSGGDDIFPSHSQRSQRIPRGVEHYVFRRRLLLGAVKRRRRRMGPRARQERLAKPRNADARHASTTNPSASRKTNPLGRSRQALRLGSSARRRRPFPTHRRLFRKGRSRSRRIHLILDRNHTWNTWDKPTIIVAVAIDADIRAVFSFETPNLPRPIIPETRENDRRPSKPSQKRPIHRHRRVTDAV